MADHSRHQHPPATPCPRHVHQRTTPPVQYCYSFAGLATLPQRILNPPEPNAPRVRGYRVRPTFKVTLEDILENKHTSPLSRTDFEDYLTYVEHDRGSVQNLYFLLWLDQYTHQYNEWKASLNLKHSNTPSAHGTATSRQTDSTYHSSSGSTYHNPTTVGAGSPPIDIPQATTAPRTSAAVHFATPPTTQAPPSHRILTHTTPSKSLAYSYFRARRTFFLAQIEEGSPLTPASNTIHRSHLRLKIHPELIYPFIADEVEGNGAGVSWGSHPSPARFALIREEVDKRLRESVNRFVEVSFTNTGNFRGWLGAGMGCITTSGGFLCTYLYAFHHKSWAYHLLSAFLIWFGSWGVLCTLNGICVCVFVFGASRQFFPWERDCHIPPPSQPLPAPSSHPNPSESKPQMTMTTYGTGVLKTPPSSGLGHHLALHGDRDYFSNEPWKMPLPPSPKTSSVPVPSAATGVKGTLARLVSAGEGPVVLDDEEAQRTLEARREEAEAAEEEERRRELMKREEQVAFEGVYRRRKEGAADNVEVASSAGESESEEGEDAYSEDGEDDDEGDDDEEEGGNRNRRRRRMKIEISEAFSADFSPPTSLVPVSLNTSVASGSPLSEVGEDEGAFAAAVSAHARQMQMMEDGESEIVINNKSYGEMGMDDDDLYTGFSHHEDDLASANVISIRFHERPRRGPPSSPPGSKLTRSYPTTQRTASERTPRTATARSTTTRTSLAGDSSQRTKVKPSPPQLMPHDHARQKEKTLPAFSFDALPTEPPPAHLTGDRRAIQFWAPMTSVQSCALIVRAHWEIVMRSILWGTVLCAVVQAVLIPLAVKYRR